ncbi:hypothetical protein ACQY0O_005642 [Thecaphora frezii]
MVQPRRLGALMALVPIAIGILLLSTLQLSLASLAEKNDMEGRMAVHVKRNVDTGPPTPEEQKTLKEIDDFLQGEKYQDFYNILDPFGDNHADEPALDPKMTKAFRELKTADDFDKYTEYIWEMNVVVLQVLLAQKQLEQLKTLSFGDRSSAVLSWLVNCVDRRSGLSVVALLVGERYR